MDVLTTDTLDSIVWAVAERLRLARELKGMTPEEAAKASGGRISSSYIRKLERAEYSPTVEAVAALCYAYGTTLSKFFSSIGDERRKRA